MLCCVVEITIGCCAVLTSPLDVVRCRHYHWMMCCVVDITTGCCVVQALPLDAVLCRRPDITIVRFLVSNTTVTYISMKPWMALCSRPM